MQHADREADAARQVAHQKLHRVKQFALRDRLKDNPHALIGLGVVLVGWGWQVALNALWGARVVGAAGFWVLSAAALWLACIADSKAYPSRGLPESSEAVLPLRRVAVATGLMSIGVAWRGIEGLVWSLGAALEWTIGYDMASSSRFASASDADALTVVLLTWSGIFAIGVVGPSGLLEHLHYRIGQITRGCRSVWSAVSSIAHR